MVNIWALASLILTVVFRCLSFEHSVSHSFCTDRAPNSETVCANPLDRERKFRAAEFLFVTIDTRAVSKMDSSEGKNGIQEFCPWVSCKSNFVQQCMKSALYSSPKTQKCHRVISIAFPIRDPSFHHQLSHFILFEEISNVHLFLLDPFSLSSLHLRLRKYAGQYTRWRHLHIDQHQTLPDLTLHPINTMQPPPALPLLLPRLLPPHLRLPPIRMRIGRQHNDCKLCVREHWTTEVEQPIDCEFYPGTHDPA